MATDSEQGVQSLDLEQFAVMDTGGRSPLGDVGIFVALLALTWSVFQLYVSSVVPYWLSTKTGMNLVFNGNEVRFIHLAFAVALACMSYPLFKNSPRDRIPA